jgi:hypothetical protein
MNYAIGQLARRYRLPLRSSGMLCGAKTVDAQAAYESVQTMWPVFLAGAHYVMHAAGWMEAGLAASFAKFVLDAEQIDHEGANERLRYRLVEADRQRRVLIGHQHQALRDEQMSRNVHERAP